MTMSEYEHLKEYLLSVWRILGEPALLERLKQTFRRELNSARAAERVISLQDLLAALERRDELSERNVAPLRAIMTLLPRDENFACMLERYKETQPTEYYGTISTRKRQQPQQPTFLNTPLSSRKKKLMYETIATEIGSHWRDLARYLEIREGQIQNICNEHKDYTEKTFKVLELSEYKSDPQKWFFKLCDALEDARRKDLRKALQEIMGQTGQLMLQGR